MAILERAIAVSGKRLQVECRQTAKHGKVSTAKSSVHCMPGSHACLDDLLRWQNSKKFLSFPLTASHDPFQLDSAHHELQ